MEPLHWTGAALLLALALLGPRAASTPRATIMSWAEFAREHGLGTDESADEPAATSRPPQRRAS